MAAAKDWRLGTVGFGYPDWSGVFYPKGMKPTDYLGYYARHFDAVELDNTFHAIPAAERVEKWAGMVPEGFEFCVKTPKEVTHELGVRVGKERMIYFLSVLRRFGKKLGPVLVQFPPTFQSRETENLRMFLEGMPGDVRLAVEFRHASWKRKSTFELLQRFGVAWVAADYGGAVDGIQGTADFLYVRWTGVHRRFEVYDREQLDVAERLKIWKERLEGAAGVGKKVYGFFNNDYSGYAVGTLGRFRQLAGLGEATVSPDEDGEAKMTQGSLFG